MARSKKNGDYTPVDSIKHADKRANIPTEELRDFVAEEERSPKYMVYPRDTSLDPQLVWKGKDEQDSEDLKVPAVPIYVQEKIHPQALIENLRETAKAGEAEPELTLFDDYDGIEFEELIDFYHHEQNWSNRMILGDSLLVMTSLAEKEALKGKVQMIYMDPPYGIKFGSNWQVSTRKRDVKDGKADDTTRQPEQVKAFRDTWELGVHSYLAYLRDRLAVARELLSESGSVFVQIGDENVHLVRALMDEVFGADNHCAQIAFKKTGGQSSSLLPGVVDYLLWYAKDAGHVKYRPLYFEKAPGETGATQYTWIELTDGTRRQMTASERAGEIPADGRILQMYPLVSAGPAASDAPFKWNGQEYRPSPNSHWKTTAAGLTKLAAAGRLHAIGNTLRFINYLSDYPVTPYTNIWTDTQTSGFAADRIYVVQTLAAVVQRCVLMATDPGDLVLDPTCGSGTTAYVAEQWGRRWITIDTSRVALALARTRLMSSRFPYYLLADSSQGARKTAEVTGQRSSTSSDGRDVRKGLVCRRVPHVTLKSIANNDEIREGMTRDQIEAAIRRSADSEVLLDQPYLDESRVRVSGPFTVESLSPHRVLDGEEDEFTAREGADYNDFATMILENLKKAGVQNTRREERLNFARVEPYAGEWINALGEAAETGERIAISIGPEHGTVGAEQVKEAAKEAIRGVGFDLLIVLGFAFDGGATETASEINPLGGNGSDFAVQGSKQYGKLRVLLCRMNPDLEYGGELLKKTGSANLFMVFGEPDVTLSRLDEDKMSVEIKGVDIYDPTTGQVRSSSPDDIACWFVDTNYNGESFFVRHAYFTGSDEPYKKLERALKADIDEDAWSTLYSTVSRPFDRPSTGKIAVKVINHYGDEVMKVYEV